MSCEGGFFDSLVLATKVGSDSLEQDRRFSTIAMDEEEQTHLIHDHRLGIEIVKRTKLAVVCVVSYSSAP